jgi:nucleoid-associated protein YgaU
MALEKDRKLRITPQPPSKLKEITVLFNPTSYSVGKEVEWKPPEPPTDESESQKAARTQRRVNAPGLEFKGGESRVLTLDLFFDVTETTLVDGKPVVDVREITNHVVALTRIEPKQGKPPVCLVQWGSAPVGSDFPFKGVVTNLKQDFTLFRSTGEPVRAKLSATFTEFLPPQEDLLQTDPELTTRRVARGDSLQALAADIYRDPALWRVIAEANNLDDPRRLAVGQTLTIPKLT